MSEFVRLCGRSELPASGQVKEFSGANRAFCVANVDGELSVLANECPHRGGPLGEGSVEDGHVICPWHAWAFDVKTGVSAHSPNASVEVFALKILEQDVLIELSPKPSEPNI